MMSPLLVSLLPKCSSCGVLLQQENRNQAGFFIKPKEDVRTHVKSADAAYDKIVSGMSNEDKLLLLNGASSDVPTAASEYRKHKEKRDDVRCLRCVNAQHKSSFDPAGFPIESVAKVMENIPPHAKIVYVINAVDFPMSINEEVFKYRPATSILFVVTKTDLFFQHYKAASGSHFFADYLYRKFGVAPENVVCASGKFDWGLSQLYSMVRDDTFFIGGVNSGKSSLILSLVVEARERKAKLPNLKRKRAAEKLQDGPRLNRQQAVRLRRAEDEKFRERNGPGVSFMPGFTQACIPVELSSRVTIWDAPGFSSGSDNLVSSLVDPGHFRQLYKGVKLPKHGTYESHYDTAKEERIVTVGGLFKLHVPPESMFRLRNLIGHPLSIFRSQESLTNSLSVQEDHPGPKGFIVDPNTRYVKYLVPWFYGSVDLVIRHFGFVSITPTGARSGNSQPVVVYLPEGIDAIVRQPIVKYITRTLAGRDKKGNTLRKEHWVGKSVTEVKRYTGKEPFYTKLVRVPEGTQLSDAEYLQEYLLRSGNTGEVGEDNRYVNWID